MHVGLIAIVLIVLGVPVLNANALIRGFAGVLENSHLERIVRWLALAALLVGFQFDLLAS